MTDNPFEAPREPSFPPLFQAQAANVGVDPFDKACSLAALGCDSGTLVHSINADRLRAAIVFAPEMPVERAMQAFCACAVGFQNAFGTLAPPEVALHLTWDGDILVNGARSGQLQAAASHKDPEATPDWLVVGLEIWLIPQDADEPGHDPDRTCLHLEGCAEVSPLELLEGWARHSLIWVNAVVEGQAKPLHDEWRELLISIGKEVTQVIAGQTVQGTFVGADANFAMLLRTVDDTSLIPLSTLLGEKT